MFIIRRGESYKFSISMQKTKTKRKNQRRAYLRYANLYCYN